MTSRSIFLTLFVVGLLSLPAKSSAQGCQGVMTPEYSSYTSFALDAGFYIYSTAVVDGFTTIGNTEYCNISGATHHGTVYNSLNGTGGWVTGTAVAPASYLSATNSEDIVAQPGVVYTDDVDDEVICSFVGALYNTSIVPITVRIAVTDFILEDWDSANCT